MVFSRKDPYRGYNFKVEIDGITRAGFRNCSGIETTQEISTYREGTDKSLSARQIPAMLTLSQVTLSRGITDDRELWDWRIKVATAKDPSEYRKNMSIVLWDDAGNEKIRWNLINCWPVKWTGPTLDSTSNEIAIETLEIAHEGITVENGKWQ
ncbi:MAG: phage tail protein [Symploca sp. SIO2E9]|nr:phage tail protein [Symploca sp. SIO2E9]